MTAFRFAIIVIAILLLPVHLVTARTLPVFPVLPAPPALPALPALERPDTINAPVDASPGDPASRGAGGAAGRLSLSVKLGAIRLERPQWNLGTCVAVSADIALGPRIFASAGASYGWASYGTPRYIHDAFGEESEEPDYKAFAITFGLGYRTAGYTEPALYLIAGGGVATYRVPFVPLPGQPYGLFGWKPGEVPFEDETSLAAGLRGGFDYPLWGNNRLNVEMGIVTNLGPASSSYFVPITAGMTFGL